jgi:hypothetical protein
MTSRPRPPRTLGHDCTQALAFDTGFPSSKTTISPPRNWTCAGLMGQDFPAIPILGTRNLGHLEDALGAVGVRMDPDQVRWLEQG